jgi:2-polyprenyl-6-methoxyphenol hydroxylase-like FAD-dependent oxidoreductase
MGGVGINLAIGDAVATANLLTHDLLVAQADPRRFERTLNPAILRRVERRRRLPTVVTQAIQVRAQRLVLARTQLDESAPLAPPAIVRALLRTPLTRIVPQVFVFGIRPERITT